MQNVKKDFEISIDGKPIDSNRVVSLRVDDRSGDESDSLEVTFDDSDNALNLPRNGVLLTVALGYRGDLREFGSYVADDCEIGNGTLSISATGFYKLDGLKTVRSNSYGLSVGEAIRDIAKRNNLEASIHKEVDQTIFDLILIQKNESDLHFLSRIIKKSGGYFKLEGKRLMVFKHGTPGTVSGRELPEVDINPGVVGSDWKSKINLREKYNSCEAYYLDLETGVTHKVKTGEEAPALCLKTRYRGKLEAMIEAKSSLDQSLLKQTTFKFSVVGNPLLRANSVVNVRDFKDEINGRYIVNQALHVVKSTYITRCVTHKIGSLI